MSNQIWHKYPEITPEESGYHWIYCPDTFYQVFLDYWDGSRWERMENYKIKGWSEMIPPDAPKDL